MKTHTDSHGVALSGATPEALDAYEQAARELRCLVGDPVGSADRALAAAPQMPMAHLLKAWLFLLGTEPAGPAMAGLLAQAQALGLHRLDMGDAARVWSARAGDDGIWRVARADDWDTLDDAAGPWLDTGRL